MTSKTCFKCHQEKPLTEFYTHRAMADGHLNKCKTCAKRDVSEYRSSNLDRIRAYERNRAKLPARVKAATEQTRKWRREDKRRMAAHNAVARAMRSGSLEREVCSRCGADKSYAHHESYDRKLDVTWLCQPCHKKRHKEMAIAGIEP